MPWTIAHQVPLSPIISQSLLKFMFIESVMNITNNLTILSSATPFCFCLKYFPATGTFPVSWLFALGGQSIGASASASVLKMNIQGWFPLELNGLISLLSKGLSGVFLQHHSSKTSILQYSAFFMVQLSHPYMTTGKTIALTIQTYRPLLAKWCLHFNLCCLSLS